MTLLKRGNSSVHQEYFRIRVLLQGQPTKNPLNFILRKSGIILWLGDTPLHAAAAGYRVRIARLLLENGADVSTRNRRGAQPLHYAADGGRPNKPILPTYFMAAFKQGSSTILIDCRSSEHAHL